MSYTDPAASWVAMRGANLANILDILIDILVDILIDILSTSSSTTLHPRSRDSPARSWALAPLF